MGESGACTQSPGRLVIVTAPSTNALTTIRLSATTPSGTSTFNVATEP
jgi:hypothetical protein